MPTFHGIQVNEPVEGIRPVREKATAVIGLLATATAANGAPTTALNEAFPLDTPVLVTDVRKAAGYAGTGGTLKLALEAIADQGSPLVIVVRVGIATGEEDDPTQGELLTGGTTNGVYTGMQAFLTAEARTGIRPRIFGAPGLDEPDVLEDLIVVAERLRGFVYGHCRDEDGELFSTRDDAVDYAGNYGQREVMLIWPDFTDWDGQAVAVALGKRAMIDHKTGWHDSLSNQVVNGVSGISHDVSFDIRSPNTDAAVLNGANITTLVRMNGFKFWGLWTCSAEPMFSFEVATRTAQFIQDIIADAEAPFVGRPMTVGLARSIVETANMRLASYTARGMLMGGRCWLDDSLNPQDQLMGGDLAADYDYGYVAPLAQLALNQRVTGKYYLGFADKVNG